MNKSRRTFLQTGAVAIPAALMLTNSTAIAEPLLPGGTLAQTHNFLIQPGLFVRLNDNFGVVSTTPWAVAQEDRDLLPFIRGERQIDLATLSQDMSGEKKSPSFITPDRLSSFRLQGEVPVMDIAGDVGLARANNQAIDLSLRFFDKLTGQATSAGPFYENSEGLPIANSQTSRILSGNMASILPYRIPIPVPFTDYTLQFRGPDYDSMRPCAPEVNRHYHLEVLRKNKYNPGRNDTLANFHIAIWRPHWYQICFAIANSEGRPSCYRNCSPTWNDIKYAVQQAFINIGIPLAIAAVMASIVATFIYGSLVVLAV